MKGNITKFILSGVVFFIIFIVLDHSIGWGMKRFENLVLNKNPSGDALRTRFVCDRVNDQVLVIGSSRATHHYIPKLMEEKLKKSVFDCGMDGCFFLYQTAVIDCILNRYSPELIIWDEVSPNVFDGGIKDEDNLSRLSKLNFYYDDNQYVCKLIQLKSKFEKYKMYSRLYRYNSCFFNYGSAFLRSRGALERKGYLPLYGIDKTLQKPKQNHIEDICYQENVELFKHVLELCSQKKVPLVISFSPRFTDDNAFDTIQYKKLLEVANEYNVPIIDFYHHPDFMSDPSLFKDVAHLNDNGAKIFTERFCEELEKLDILKSAQTNN